MAAIALPASRTLPPPKAMTKSQYDSFAWETPSVIVSRSGSPATDNGTAPRPASYNSVIKLSDRSILPPVTTSAEPPNGCASDAISFKVPGPKMILVAVANSKCIREHDAAALPGHQRKPAGEQN